MRSVGMLVAVGLATLSIFACGVPTAPEPPPAVEVSKPVEPLRPLAPAADPSEKLLRVRDRDVAIKLLREEERRHPELSFELVEFGAMTRVGPQYRLIAKKKASSAVVKTH